MNFKVFVRTFFLVVVLSAVFYTVYAIIADEPAKTPLENSPAATTGIVPEHTGSNTAVNGESIEASGGKVSGGETAGVATAATAQESYVKEKAVIHISALGDVALGQDHNYKHMDSFDYVYDKIGGDYSYFFSNVVDILSQDDLTIANLETTLSNETEQAEKYDYGNNYWFNGKPEYANILVAGSVEVANLANNHTYDFGQKGYDATREALKEVEVDYFGYSEVLYKEVKGIRIGMVGFNQLGNYEQGLDMTEFKKEVEEMTKMVRAECDLLIANFHWGKEYQYTQEKIQKELAYLAIDTGADLVIGHHPHVLQPIETYNGKTIAYSLGNFCFGGNKTPKDYDTAIFQQSFVFDSNNELQEIKEPNIIACSVSSKASINDYRPAIATETQASRVYKKLNYTPSAQAEGGKSAATSGSTDVSKGDMIQLDTVMDNIIIDLKYATEDNIVKKPVYESNIAYLRKGTADKLDKANQILMKQGYRIKVWDAYRAKKYHQILYDSAANKSYFMDPKIGSNHTRGAAVDVTLVDADGNEVDMPSGFDEMSEKAHRTYKYATEEQKKNALLLEKTMKEAGFIPLKTEWWHFDDTEYKNYELLADYNG